MKRFINIAVAAVLVALLVGYMVTYTVRFNEAVIVKTFGRISDGGVKNAPAAAADGAAGAGDEAGLHFKLPWPVQQVAARYDTRVQALDGTLEQFSTRDRQSVSLRVFAAWRVSDPLAFYRKIGSEVEADRVLRNRIRGTQAIVGDYTLDQLANVDPQQLKLDELGRRMRDAIQAEIDSLDYGITVEEVGVKKLVLPAAVTQAVMQRMAAERARLAAVARDEGQTQQATIVSQAGNEAEIIRSFAETAANRTRVLGDQEAASLMTAFAENQDLATFLQEIDALRVSLADKTEFFVDATRMYPFNRTLARFLTDGGDSEGDSPEGQDQADALTDQQRLTTGE